MSAVTRSAPSPVSAAHNAAAAAEETLAERRRHIIEVAARLLVEEGAHGLSLRHLAREVGGSTQLIYTLFGGKPGLADELYAEGFRRLNAAMIAALDDAPPIGDPDRICALGRAYREFARAQPDMFSVMFGRAIPGFTPASRTRHTGRSATFGIVVDTVAECLAAGTLVGGTAEDIARLCWVTGHGVASLEAGGLLAADNLDAFVEMALKVPVDAYRRP